MTLTLFGTVFVPVLIGILLFARAWLPALMVVAVVLQAASVVNVDLALWLGPGAGLGVYGITPYNAVALCMGVLLLGRLVSVGVAVPVQVRGAAAQAGAEVVPVCAKLEAEIAELDEADRAEMLASSGLAEPALAVLARAAYRVLGLQSYFTAGEKEVRAWTVPVGATAPQAAGVIHTDFEKGFIRAEIYSLPDLESYKSEKEIRGAGKLRIEGKEYVMQDGDICHFLFNR